jgi:phosphate transport system substrate-binding protein
LSAYLLAMQPAAWAKFTSACGVPDAMTSFWPFGEPGCLQQGIAEKGSDGIANFVANPGLGVGAIGYVEAGYAIGRRFPVVAVKNQSGHFTLPTAQNVATALTHTILDTQPGPKFGTSNLSHVYTAPEANAYPISSYSYMIVPTDNSITPDKGAVLGKFINYFACAGQQEAARLGYSPMPKQLVGFAFDAEKKIPGAPPAPALTYKACPNPTFVGSLGSGGGGTTIPGSDNPGGTGGGSTGGSTGGGSTSGGSSSGGNTSGGSTGGSGSVVTETQTPAVLSDDALASLQLAAGKQIAGYRPASPAPLIVGAGVLLLLIFAPLLALRLFTARRQRRTGSG